MSKHSDELSDQDKEFLDKYRSDIFMHVDAKIHFTRLWDEDQEQYITRYRWTGGKVAAISDELMAEISTNPDVGDLIELGELHVILTGRSSLGDFWLVRRVDG